jgi:hypothetical protein
MSTLMIAHDKQPELTSGEAALLIGCTTGTVGNLASQGRLRWRRLKNGARVFRLDDVLQFAEERRQKPERRGRPIKLRDLIATIQTSNAPSQDGRLQTDTGETIGSTLVADHVSASAAARSKKYIQERFMLTHLDDQTDVDKILPPSVPALQRDQLLRPEQASTQQPKKRALHPENPFAVAVTQAYLLLEQRLELRAAGDESVTRAMVREAEVALETAEAEADAELRRVIRREKMESAANQKMEEQRARELRGRILDAEQHTRESIGPVLTIEYRGLVITAHVERAMDQTARQFAMKGFADALQAVRRDFERQLNVVIASGAKGVTPAERAVDIRVLEADIADVARRAIRRNLLTVSRRA